MQGGVVEAFLRLGQSTEKCRDRGAWRKGAGETEALSRARNAYILQYPSSGFSGSEKSNEGYEQLLAQYETDFEPQYRTEFEKQCDFIYRSLRENVIATIHGDIKAAKRHAAEINRLLKKTNFSDSIYQIKIEPAYNENGQFYDMLMAGVRQQEPG